MWNGLFGKISQLDGFSMLVDKHDGAESIGPWVLQVYSADIIYNFYTALILIAIRLLSPNDELLRQMQPLIISRTPSMHLQIHVLLQKQPTRKQIPHNLQPNPSSTLLDNILHNLHCNLSSDHNSFYYPNVYFQCRQFVQNGLLVEEE